MDSGPRARDWQCMLWFSFALQPADAATDRPKEKYLHAVKKTVNAAVEAMRMRAFLDGLTDDVNIVFANHPTTLGKDEGDGAITRSPACASSSTSARSTRLRQ
jgi:ribosomal protein L12E/L44/L45/RPP1/RPP2